MNTPRPSVVGPHAGPRLQRGAAVITVCAIVAGLTGCQNMNPLNQDDYFVERAARERLHQIDSTNFEVQSRSPGVTVDEAVQRAENSLAAPDRSAGETSLELSLAEVRAAALANNLDLRVSLYDPAIAEEAVNIEEARFEWTLTASASRLRTDTPTASTLSSSQATIDNAELGVDIPLRTGGSARVALPVNRTKTNNFFSTLNPSHTADLRFSISQPLLRGAGLYANTHAIRVARYQQRVVETQTKLEAIRVLANADRAYWRLVAARRALEVSQQQFELAQAQLQRAQRRLNAGEGLELDVTRAESGLAQRLQDIIISQNLILQRQRELKQLMNREDLPVNSPVELVPSTDPNPLGLDLDPDALADIAIENRMEMLEQELQLAAAASTIDFEKNQSLPLVTLDYSYTVNGLGSTFGNAFDMLAQKSFEDWSAGFRAEIPIGNEAAEARIHRAILQRVQRLATRDQRELAIRKEVLDTLDQLESDWQRILASRQSVILATRVLDGERRQFELGERTSTDVLDAATQLADAQLSEIQALVDYQITQVDLAFATGTLLGAERVRWEALTYDDVDPANVGGRALDTVYDPPSPGEGSADD